MQVKSRKTAAFEALVDEVYDAATNVGRWETVLSDIMEMFEGTSIHLAHYDIQTQRLNFSFHKGYEQVGTEIWDRYQELLPADPRLHMFERLPGKPQSCYLDIGHQAVLDSDMYKEVLCKAGVEYTLGVTLDGFDDTTTFFAVMRDKNGQPFREAECELLGDFIPHFKRAMKIHKRFAMLDLSNRTALQALDSLSKGIVLLGEGGLVKHANANARSLASQNDGFHINGPKDAELLRFNDLMTQSVVVEAANNAISYARNAQILPGKSVPVPRPSGEIPYSALISTLWGNHIHYELGALDDPVAVLFITDPSLPVEAPAELLQRLFGLTNREADLLECLVAGQKIKTAAQNLGIAENTARSHFKTIFSKTGTSSQTELIARVLASPIWHQSQPTRETVSSGANSLQ